MKVPVELLLREWNGREAFEESEDEDVVDMRLNRWSQSVSGPAKLAMKRVDYTIKKLRESATINTLQRSSLQVAAALLEVVSTKECQNPFLCLHQAAVFASQGAKGGNNDEQFKKPLPEESLCTPVDALLTLGRADCLRAIHFTNEAIFLCSYVANVCRLHRDRKTEYPWTPKWRVIAISMYTISVAIDATIISFMEGEDRNTALQSWEKDVKAEISRARSDAIALQKAFSYQPFDTNNSTTIHRMTSINKNHYKDSSGNNNDSTKVDLKEDQYSNNGTSSYEEDIKNIEEDDYDDDNDFDEGYETNEVNIEENLSMQVDNPPALSGPIMLPMEAVNDDAMVETFSQDEEYGESDGITLDGVQFTAV